MISIPAISPIFPTIFSGVIVGLLTEGVEGLYKRKISQMNMNIRKRNIIVRILSLFPI